MVYNKQAFLSWIIMYIYIKSETPHFVPLYIQNLGCVHLHYNQYNIFDNPATSFYFFYDKANPSNWYIRLSTNNPNAAFFITQRRRRMIFQYLQIVF